MTPMLNLKPYVVTRRAIGDAVLGRAGALTPSSVNIIANIHHVSDRQMKALPEARHSEDIRYVFTKTELFTERSAFKADRIAVGSDTFEVFMVSGPWVGGFYRAFITKVNNP